MKGFYKITEEGRDSRYVYFRNSDTGGGKVYRTRIEDFNKRDPLNMPTRSEMVCTDEQWIFHKAKLGLK